MISQIVLDDEITGKRSVGLLLTSGDIDDYEVARLGERLLRAGEAAKGHLGRVTYRFEVLDAEVPGLELQTAHIGRKRLIGSHDALTIDGQTVNLIMKDESWAPWIGQCQHSDDPAIPADMPLRPEIVPVGAAETLLGSANPPTPPEAIVAEARAKCEAGAGDFYTDLIEHLGGDHDPWPRPPLPHEIPVLKAIAKGMDQDYSKLAEDLAAADRHPASGMTGVLPVQRPCDRVPEWLWPLVALVVVGLIIAGVR